MKKRFLSAILGGLLSIAITGAAMAAQVVVSVETSKEVPGATWDSVEGVYKTTFATPTTFGKAYDSTKYPNLRTNASVRFNDDGKTNYPYEIYLPNESNPAQYRIHTNYTKNTDACASCHATHTAVGPSLLQWYSVYETCMACHDGTVTTTYNVKEGYIGKGKDPEDTTFGGHFGLGNEGSLSSHNVTGAVEIAAAPGGSVVEDTVKRDYGVTSYVMWKRTFGCESCHSPHGQGGNARILHPDPNGWASKQAEKRNYEYNLQTVGSVAYVTDGTNNVTLLKGFPYKLALLAQDGTDITGKFTVNNDGDFVNGSYTIITVKDSAYQLSDIKKVIGTAAISVRMQITNYLDKDSSGNNAHENVKHVSGINSFCGACHVDYNTEAQVAVNGKDKIMENQANRPGYGALTGDFSKAHRHAVGVKWNYGDAADKTYIGWDNKPMLTMGTGENGSSGSSGGSYISCLTCHFAHGASEDLWTRWTKKYGVYTTDGWDKAGALKEIAGSSALKKLPNMGTCEACHQKGDAAQGYNANTLQAVSSNPTVVNGVFTQETASFVGMANTTASCAKCHKEYVEKFLETQHPYMVSPWDPSKYFAEFDGVDGNASKEAIDALNYFKNDVTNNLHILDTIHSSVYPEMQNVQEKDLISMGQIPFGNSAASREIVARTVNNGNTSYTVICTVTYNPSTKHWYIDGDVTLKPSAAGSGYERCFTCHGSLIKSSNDNLPAKTELDKWYAYFDNNSNAKPSYDLGITCEACHGEASNHVKQPSATNIFNPRNVDAKSQSRVCGRCHVGSSGANKNSYNVVYTPWKLAQPTNPDYSTIVTNIDAAKFADGVSGKGQTHHPEFQMFARTAHFQKNVVSCTTCHDSHSDEISGQLKLTDTQLCASCHDATFTVEKYMGKVPNNDGTLSNVIKHDFGTMTY